MQSQCPGWYCGRPDNNSDCGSCPRGFRRNDSNFICEPCTDIPSFYDWLYLGFMVLLCLVLHWFFIDMVSMRRRGTSSYQRAYGEEYHVSLERSSVIESSYTSPDFR